MNAVSKFFLAMVLVCFTGCALIPKPVEFFQSKVKEVPSHTQADKEVQKETADLAARKAQQTYKAALAENTSTNVLTPAQDSALLTLSLSKSLGSPLSPWNGDAELLSLKLDHVEARLDARLDKFADKQQENVGKKIEGSGAFSVPWIVYVVIVGGLIFAGFIALKVIATLAAASNPGVAVGTRIASIGAQGLAKGFGQMVTAGQSFKDDVVKHFGESETSEKIIDLFHKNHKAAQDSDIQTAIRELTK